MPFRAGSTKVSSNLTHGPRNQLLARNEDNSDIINIGKMRLLLSNESINPLDRVKEAQRLLSFIESIFKSGSTGAVFMYLLDRGAATAWLLQVNLELNEATVYRSLKRLRAMGLVTPEWRIPKQKRSRGGPRPMVWALLDASIEDVAHAARDHQRALSPNYRVAEELVQQLLPECIQKEITYTKIMKEAGNKLAGSNQRIRDISELASIILKENGIRVWR